MHRITSQPEWRQANPGILYHLYHKHVRFSGLTAIKELEPGNPRPLLSHRKYHASTEHLQRSIIVRVGRVFGALKGTNVTPQWYRSLEKLLRYDQIILPRSAPVSYNRVRYRV